MDYAQKQANKALHSNQGREAGHSTPAEGCVIRLLFLRTPWAGGVSHLAMCGIIWGTPPPQRPAQEQFPKKFRRSVPKPVSRPPARDIPPPFPLIRSRFVSKLLFGRMSKKPFRHWQNGEKAVSPAKCDKNGEKSRKAEMKHTRVGTSVWSDQLTPPPPWGLLI